MAKSIKWKATLKVANCGLLLAMLFLLVNAALGQNVDGDDEKIPYLQ